MHPVTIAEIEKLVVEGGLIPAGDWPRIAASAEMEGMIDFERLVDAIDRLPLSEGGVEAPRLTVLHRTLLRKLFKGKRINFPGIRIGNFLLLEKLAEGGQAMTFRARELHSSQPNRQPRIRLVKAAVNPKDRRLHEREVEILKRLQAINCQRVPRYYSSGFDREHPYLVMSFREGGDLRKFIKRHGPVNVHTAVHIISKLVDSLRTAHNSGVLHRDIKPSNLIYNPTNHRVSLIDWGLGTLPKLKDENDPFGEASQLSHSATKLGTFAWMSPEHFRSSQAIVPASDLYAVGCVLFYILTGEAPFAGSAPELTYHHTHSPRPLVTERRQALGQNPKEIPQQIDALIQQLMSVEVSARPSYDRILEMLRNAVERPIAQPKSHSPSQFAKGANSPGPVADTTMVDQEDTAASKTAFVGLQDSEDRRSSTPLRTRPALVNPDLLSRALPSFYELSQQKWPDLTAQQSQAALKTIRQQWEQFNSEEHIHRASELQKLAFEKSRHGNLSVAIEQWQAAWLWTPWDTTLKRHSLRVMQETAQRPRNITLSIPKPSQALRQGNIHKALQSCESALAKNPWSVEALWEEAMAMDLLGYWHACNHLIEVLIKTHFEYNHRPVPLFILSAKVAAKVKDFKRARRLLNAVPTIDRRYADSLEFHDFVNTIEAEIHAMVIDQSEKRP